VAEAVIATKDTVRQTYDNIAELYDRVGAGMFAKFGARLAEKVPLVTGARVLDIATGTGAVLLPSARRVGPQGQVTGIDLSGNMLKEAGRRVLAAGLTNVELLEMDAELLKFPDETFDIVTCGFGIFFCPDMEVGLREMYRVCKPGGCAGVSVFNRTPPPDEPAARFLWEQFTKYGLAVPSTAPNPSDFSQEEVEDLLVWCGFHSVKAHCETDDIVYAGAEDYWTALLGSTARPTILKMNEKVRARFRDEYLARLRPYALQDGLHLPVGIIYALGWR
jgi:ubiquinone/menaquinone biosynthesis C-methylase UbiE